MMDPLAIKYMKDNWHLTKKSIVVVVDEQGKVVNLNALHMMWIWGSVAYPFTSLREEQLWNEELWRIELLVDSIEPRILQWVRQLCTIVVFSLTNQLISDQIFLCRSMMESTFACTVVRILIGSAGSLPQRNQ